MSKRPEKLLQQAQRDRERELETLARDRRKAREKARPKTVSTTETWRVWWYLRRDYHIALVVFGCLGFWFGLFWMTEPEGQTAGIACVALGALALAVLARSALVLRTWRARVPFEVVGWASLVDEEFFWLDEFWRHVAVTVEGRGDTAVRDEALRGLCAAMGRAYSRAEASDDDPRIPWKVTEETARGSANRVGARHLAMWCTRVLAPVAVRYRVERVILTVAPKPVTVNAQSSD